MVSEVAMGLRRVSAVWASALALGFVLVVTPGVAAQSDATAQTFDLQVEGLTERGPFL
jgi:hypothetical protein